MLVPMMILIWIRIPPDNDVDMDSHMNVDVGMDSCADV